MSSVRRALVLSIAALLLVALASPGFASKPLKVAIVFDIGGLGDQSFNDSAYEGLKRVQKELGAEIAYVESRTPSDYEPNLAMMARSGYDMVWAIGFLMADALEKVAPQFPNTKFGIIDFAYDDAKYAGPLKNVMGVVYKEEEGSFLVGVIAAMTTKTNRVGFLGGMQFPLIEKFEAGFKAGVWKVNPSITILTNYAGSFNDPAKGKTIALSMFRQRCDVIYHASGGTGIGMIEAAKENGFWAIGVDSDQYHLAPKQVLTSMIKRVDVGVFEGTKLMAEGKFKAGTTVLGLAADGVGFAPTTSKYASPAAIAAAEEWASKIKKGEYVVPELPAEAAKLAK
ncbi:MAG: BMP family ABC transporter substrate-binding protein [Firmicutes bacterium]|nr:BMP family ABC transporter substrate-binding protein [Bacillota bacterium]